MFSCAQAPVIVAAHTFLFGRAWEITSDLLIATAIICALLLLLGVVVVVSRRVAQAM